MIVPAWNETFRSRFCNFNVFLTGTYFIYWVHYLDNKLFGKWRNCSPPEETLNLKAQWKFILMQHLSFLWFKTIRFETRSTQTITWCSTLKASAALWLNKSNNDGRTCVVLKVIWLPNPLQLLHTNSHPITPSHPLYSLWKQSNLYSVQSDSIPGVIRKEMMRSWMPERADLVSVSSCMNFNHILFHTRIAAISL